ncbi:MAG: hypothetical protein HZB33_06640 [Nitrospirae bacterium]|nr:hypothetical protein [Nitrospirota bacterium]
MRSGGKTYTLDPDVRKLALEYYDLSEDLKSGEWVSEWDTDEKKYLPTAVKVRITYEEKGQKTELPDLIINIHTQKRLQ